MSMYYHYHDTPIGSLLLAGDGERLGVLGFPGGAMARRHGKGWVEDPAPFAEAGRQLDEYFDGAREAFDLPLALSGTAFQKKVWSALREIPYGETWSYGRLAMRIGRPAASRAVGAANGMNPVPVIVPCHRVIGADGRLAGFGGGLRTKKFLLGLESRTVAGGARSG